MITVEILYYSKERLPPNTACILFCSLSKTLPLTNKSRARRKWLVVHLKKKICLLDRGLIKLLAYDGSRKETSHTFFNALIQFCHATVTSGKSSWFVQEIYHVAISHGTKLVDFLFNRLSCRANK